MQTLFVQTIFGWPAIILALVLSSAGVIWMKAWLVAIGALVLMPASWFLSGYPPLRGLAPLLPFLLLGASYAVHRKKRLLAGLLTLPAIVFSLWLAVIVITQAK
jgi:hypothetical protein